MLFQGNLIFFEKSGLKTPLAKEFCRFNPVQMLKFWRSPWQK